MEIEFTSRRENALLGREEIEFVATHPEGSTPERATVRDNIAARTDANSGLVVVDHMDTEYGITRTEGYAKVYDSVEALRDTEADYVLVRNGLIEADEAEDAQDQADGPEFEAAEPDEAEEDEPEPDEAEDEADEGDGQDDDADEDEAEEAEAEA